MSENKTLFSQFFSGTFSIGVARISTLALGVLSVMVATRYTTTEGYGTYVLIILIINFLVEFMSFGLTLVIPKYLASSGDDQYQRVVINTAFYFRLITIIFVSLVFFIFRPLLAHLFGDYLLTDLFGSLPILFGLVSLTLLFQTILRGQFRFNAIGIIEFISNIVEFALLALFLVVFGYGLLGLVLAKIISGIFESFLAYRAIRIEHRWEFDTSILKEMLVFGFPLQLQYIFGFAYSKLDTIIVGALLGTKGVAYYDVARKIPESLMQMYSVFISVYFPISANLYASDQKEKTEKVLNSSTRILSFLTIFATLISILFGKDIIVLLFSESYLNSYIGFVLLMIGMTLDVLENTFGYSLVAIGESDKPLVVNIIRAIVSLIGNLVLLPIMGFVGAAIVNVISNVVATPLDALFLWRKKIKPTFTDYIKLLVVLGILSLIFIFLDSPSFLIKLVITSFYFPLCLILSIITVSDISSVYNEFRVTISDIIRKIWPQRTL